MAISKRLRFAVLERDGHTCQYCGLSAGEEGAVLQVDHIVPVSMGGRDEPQNLLTACRDCNAGKGSSIADSPKIKAPDLDAHRWARAIELAAKERRASAATEKEARGVFVENWPWSSPPDDYRATISKFVRLGLGVDDIERILRQAAERSTGFEHCWRYFCKVCWSQVDLIREAAKRIVEEDRAADPEPSTAADVLDLPAAAPPPVLRSHLEQPYWCIECDDRKAAVDGMCEQCRRNLYEGIA